MAEQKTASRKKSKKSRSGRENQHEADRDQDTTGHEEEVERYEEVDDEPRDEAEDEFDDEEDGEPQDEAEDEFDDEPEDEAEDAEDDEDDVEEDDEPEDEAEDEFDDEDAEEPEDEDDEPDAQGKAPPDFEADMYDLQEELGEDWIVRFSVQGDKGWLTAEKEDGSQHVEATTASALIQAVELINKDGGRPS